MNRKMILGMVGRIILLEATVLVLPLIVSLIYHEVCWSAILITIGIALVLGLAMTLPCRATDDTIFAREGFVIVALAWLLLSAIGALPFVISGEIRSYIDAFFETVSGFTTTGATILTDVESMSRGLLFWRSFTHWIGGMGVLVLIMAILPSSSGRAIHIMRAEVPGPVVGKMLPRLRDTAKILYIIYLVLTLIEVIFLVAGGMSVFESLLHAFGTAGTGGFGIKADSIASYSPYLQWVISIFMLMFGINFNIYYLLLIKNFRSFLKSTETWVYLGIVIVTSAIVAANIFPQFGSFSDSIRHSVFQISSIITTTGYSTADFNVWPTLSKGIILILMFFGGCAGSTAGGLKIARVIMLFRQALREIHVMLHPRAVSTVRIDGKPVEDKTLNSVSNYFLLYIMCFVLIFLLVCIEPFSIETNFSAAASCFNNVGPGLGSVGPLESYAAYSGFTKIVLSIAMLLGRLEIYPLLLAAVAMVKPRSKNAA